MIGRSGETILINTNIQTVDDIYRLAWTADDNPVPVFPYFPSTMRARKWKRRLNVSRSPRRRRVSEPHPGRNPLPENLPCREEVIACDANCTRCGRVTMVIGYDTGEAMDRAPAKWVVCVTEREKPACEKVLRRGWLNSPRIVDKGYAVTVGLRRRPHPD